jgi:subtilisin family serine protease
MPNFLTKNLGLKAAVALSAAIISLNTPQALAQSRAVAKAPVSVIDRAPEVRAQGLVPEQYIVVFNKSVRNAPGLVNTLARRHGFSVQHVYQFALKGFSASMSPEAANALAKNPNVAYVEQDSHAHPLVQSYVPAGVLRINADASPMWDVEGTLDANAISNDIVLVNPVAADIAIIDSGVINDPDLNVVQRVDCSGGSPRRGSCVEGSASDGTGHGSHVAGTAAGSGTYGGTDGYGLIGVAPGANLWAVKVFKDDGRGYCSWAIAGVDWVTQYAAEIDVANMSLGCSSNSQAMKTAIANSTAAGVLYVVAAGNDNTDAGATSPANSEDAITVSAIADYDGVGGGLDSFVVCPGENDDAFASFSNHGQVVDIAAPGVCVASMLNDGALYYASGTSMASPHVAGAAALIHAELMAKTGSRPTPQEIRAELMARAIPQGDAEGYDSTNDDDNFREPLLNLAPATNGPTVSITGPSAGTVSGTVTITADANDDGSVTQVEFFVDGNSIAIDNDPAGGWSASWDTSSYSDGPHTVTAVATDNESNTGSDSVTVTVDNFDDPPAVTLTNPTDGSSVSGTVTVTANANDDGSVREVEFLINGATIGTDSDGSDGWSASWDTTANSDGIYTVTAVATDDGSKSNSDVVSVSVNNTIVSDLMYVSSMEFKKQGPNLSITVTIRRDSDGDGAAEDADAAAAGATISQVLLTNLDTGTTYFETTEIAADGNGSANYKVLRPEPGTYRFEVLEVVLDPHVWDDAGTITGHQNSGVTNLFD